MRNYKKFSNPIKKLFRGVLALAMVGAFGLSVNAAESGIVYDIHVGRWMPAGQEVIIGLDAKLPNSCSAINGIEHAIVNSGEKGIVELNINIEIVDIPFNIEPEVEGEFGCRNEEYYVYERINFGALEAGRYVVQVFENGKLSLSKNINVSKYPLDPDFSEPGGFYNIGDRESVFANRLLGSL